MTSDPMTGDPPVDLAARRSAEGYVVESSAEAYRGAIFTVRQDLLRFPDGSVANRDVVRHGGAVGIVSVDESDSVVLIQQYRHTAESFLWELPAGILDHPGEDPLEAARRELAEEVAMSAGTWHTLVDVQTAPGFSNEMVRVYLAEDLYEVTVDFEHTGEEADLVVRRVPLADCLEGVHAGHITNCVAVAGLLAADRALRDRTLLRPPDSPWPRLRNSG